jgi:hypothetical protein
MNELIEYVHEKNNTQKPIVGVVVARLALQEGKEVIGLGWSKCCKADLKRNKGKFDKQRAINIAYDRTILGTSVNPPRDVLPVLLRMRERAVRYFKGKPLSFWV